MSVKMVEQGTNPQSPIHHRKTANKLAKTVSINFIESLESCHKFTAIRKILNQDQKVNLVRELCDIFTNPGLITCSSLWQPHWNQQSAFLLLVRAEWILCSKNCGCLFWPIWWLLKDWLKGFAFILSNFKLSQGWGGNREWRTRAWVEHI